MKIFCLLFVLLSNILLAQQRYSDAASDRLVEIHEQYDRESSLQPDIQMVRTLINESKEEKRAVSFLKMHSNNRIQYKTYITKADEGILKVPANEKWYILIKDISQGENIELYSKNNTLAIKAIPTSNNSILLLNAKDSTLNKILIQEYLEILSGAKNQFGRRDKDPDCVLLILLPSPTTRLISKLYIFVSHPSENYKIFEKSNLKVICVPSIDDELE